MPAKQQPYTKSFLDAFRQLHAAFTRLMTLQPWTIVDEFIILGVKHPVTGELYYAYFMGELGEVVGFNLYRGPHIAPWLASREEIGGEEFSEADMLSHTFYQLTVSKKTGLGADVKDLHAAAGIAVPRGKGGYLEAISYRGGYAPVMMDEAQMAEVAPLLPGFDYLLNAIGDDELDEAEDLDESGVCYVAVQQEDGSWQATEEQLPEPAAVNLFEVNPANTAAWTAVNMLSKSKEPFLVHAQLLPMPIGNDSGVGFFPLMLLCIGMESGLILGTQLLEADHWKDAATPALLQILQGQRALPGAFHIADARLLPLAKEAARMLGIEVFKNEDTAELLDEIIDSLGAGLGF